MEMTIEEKTKLPHTHPDYMPARDEKGLLLPGHTANPLGKPRGVVSLVSILKEKLSEKPDDTEDKTYAQLIVDKLLVRALKDGDTTMLVKILEYVDGKPVQPIRDDTGKEEMDAMRIKINAMFENIKSKHDKTEIKTITTGSAKDEPVSV